MTGPESKSKLQRLQFDFQRDAVFRIDAMVADTGATSRAEVVRRALTLYEHFIHAVKQDGEIIIRAADGSERRLLFLDIPITKRI